MINSSNTAFYVIGRQTSLSQIQLILKDTFHLCEVSVFNNLKAASVSTLTSTPTVGKTYIALLDNVFDEKETHEFKDGLERVYNKIPIYEIPFDSTTFADTFFLKVVK